MCRIDLFLWMFQSVLVLVSLIIAFCRCFFEMLSHLSFTIDLTCHCKGKRRVANMQMLKNNVPKCHIITWINAFRTVIRVYSFFSLQISGTFQDVFEHVKGHSALFFRTPVIVFITLIRGVTIRQDHFSVQSMQNLGSVYFGWHHQAWCINQSLIWLTIMLDKATYCILIHLLNLLQL